MPTDSTQLTDHKANDAAWVELGSLVVLSARKTASKLRVIFRPPTPWRAGQAQVTHCTMRHRRAPQEVGPASGHQTFHLLPSESHSESTESPSDLFRRCQQLQPHHLFMMWKSWATVTKWYNHLPVQYSGVLLYHYWHSRILFLHLKTLIDDIFSIIIIYTVVTYCSTLCFFSLHIL